MVICFWESIFISSNLYLSVSHLLVFKRQKVVHQYIFSLISLYWTMVNSPNKSMVKIKMEKRISRLFLLNLRKGIRKGTWLWYFLKLFPYSLDKYSSSMFANRMYAKSSMNQASMVCDGLRNPMPKVWFRIQTLQLVKPRVISIIPRYWGCLTKW